MLCIYNIAQRLNVHLNATQNNLFVLVEVARILGKLFSLCEVL